MRLWTQSGGRLAILAVVALSLSVHSSANAAVPLICINSCGLPAATGTGTGAIVVSHGISQTVPGRSPRPAHPGSAVNYAYVNEALTPSCAGNVRGGQDNVCGAAINTCPSIDQVRFWIWHQRVEVSVVPPPTREAAGPWLQLPGTFCLGPDDPGVSTVGRVIAQVQDYFASQTLPLPRWSVRTDPGPRTLIRFPTSFSAGSVQPRRIEAVILGTAVHITAVPTRWTWFFGDGTSVVTNEPGRPKTDDITHAYASLGRHVTRVVVQWQGTFRVGNAGQQYDLRQPATVTGPGSTVAVLQSRAELVAG